MNPIEDPAVPRAADLELGYDRYILPETGKTGFDVPIDRGGTTHALDEDMNAGRTKILVVDDERPFAAAVSEYLTDHGFEVRSAANCFEALATSEPFRPDVIVTDLKMPCSSGLDLIEILRSAGHGCAVILLTAFGQAEDIARAERLHVDGFLRKPCALDRLVRTIEEAVHRRGQKRFFPSAIA